MTIETSGNLPPTISNAETVDPELLTVCRYLDLDYGINEASELIKKIVKEKSDLCEKFLEDFFKISGLKREELKNENDVSKAVAIAKNKQSDLLKNFEELLKQGIDSSRETSYRYNNNPDSGRAFDPVISKLYQKQSKVIKRIKDLNSCSRSHNNSTTITHIPNSAASKNNDKFTSLNQSSFVTGLNDRTEERKRGFRRNLSQEQIGFQSNAKYSEFLNSISLSDKIFETPREKSYVDYKLMARKNFENNKMVLKNLMKSLNYCEKFSGKVNELVKDEIYDFNYEKKRLFNENSIEIFVGEEKKRPLARERKPLNYDKKKENKRTEYLVGMKKDFKKMTYEERILEIDKNAKLNPEVLYNNRQDILSKNHLILNGNDIIFSVPRIEPLFKLPQVFPNKKHKAVENVLDKTELGKLQLLTKLKEENIKKYNKMKAIEFKVKSLGDRKEFKFFDQVFTPEEY